MIVASLGLVGLAAGSFLNVVIDRLPQGRSLVGPPSHCEACGQPLAPRDLVPVFSYLWLRGRCRYCGAAIPRRLPLVELATGLVFALLGLKFGASLQLLFSLVYASVFIAVFVIDLERSLIPNIIIYPAMAMAVAFSFFWPGLGVVRALVGGGVGFGLMLVPYIASRGGMGEGDVKLAGMIGLATGFPLVFVALLLGAVLGGVVAAILLALRIKGRKDAIPFGPYLAASGMIALLWGRELLDWYLGLLSLPLAR